MVFMSSMSVLCYSTENNGVPVPLYLCYSTENYDVLAHYSTQNYVVHFSIHLCCSTENYGVHVFCSLFMDA